MKSDVIGPVINIAANVNKALWSCLELINSPPRARCLCSKWKRFPPKLNRCCRCLNAARDLCYCFRQMLENIEVINASSLSGKRLAGFIFRIKGSVAKWEFELVRSCFDDTDCVWGNFRKKFHVALALLQRFQHDENILQHQLGLNTQRDQFSFGARRSRIFFRSRSVRCFT